MKVFFAIIGAFAVLYWIVMGLTSYMSPTGQYQQTVSHEPETKTEFKGGVHFTGTQFQIINLDDYDCENSMMVVDNKYQLNGYTLKVGETYTVGGAQFATRDGTRFNPFAQKPESFAIICQGNNSLSNASWTGTF